MKFKLDENFGTRTQHLFKAQGHDVETVLSEGLQGSTDESLLDICRHERRCMVTLDMDFANVLQFSPSSTSGIAVIRLPKNPSIAILERLISQFLQALKSRSIEGSLWIVEMGRIRIHDSESN